MAKVIITNTVTDVEHWLGFKERRAVTMGQFGSDIKEYVALDGSNQVAMTVDIDDMDRLRQALVDSPPPHVAAELESQGVILPITAFIER